MSNVRGTLPFVASCALIAFGIPGLLSLLLVLPAVPGTPRALLLVGPLVLLVVATLAGSWAAPRIGLESRVATRVATAAGAWLPRDLGRVALGGVLAGVIVAIVDHLTRAAWQVAGAPASVVEAWRPGGLVVGLLYGGVVEEVLFRWGLVSGIAWLLWRLTGARRAALVLSVSIAAVAFGLGHLPALAVDAAHLSTALVVRTVGLNAVIALGLGALFVWRDLESAIVAHAMLHVGFALTALLVAA